MQKKYRARDAVADDVDFLLSMHPHSKPIDMAFRLGVSVNYLKVTLNRANRADLWGSMIKNNSDTWGPIRDN